MVIMMVMMMMMMVVAMMMIWKSLHRSVLSAFPHKFFTSYDKDGGGSNCSSAAIAKINFV